MIVTDDERQTERLIGTLIDHYRVVSLIGKGGMGEVYLAHDTRVGRQVALKLLSGELTLQTERVRRFQQEARAASALNHPNILTIYEIAQTDAGHFIATELVEGMTLREHMMRARMRLLDSNHEVPIEQPREFAALIQAFVAGLQ